MPNFEYVARNAQGEKITGLLEAPGTSALTARLSAMGYTVTGIRQESATRSAPAGALFRKANPHDLIELYLELGTMLKSGIPLTVALKDAGTTAGNRALAEAIADVAARVQGGEGLSSAMRSRPAVFPALACDLVEAGETTGRLDDTFLGLAGYLQRDIETRDQVKAALRYPAIVFGAAVVVVGTTITYVLPNFAVVFTRLNEELPLPTRVILFAGEWVSSNGFALLLVLGVGALLGLWLSRRPDVAEFLDGVRLRLPALGMLHRKVATARFARILGLLLSGGVPVLQALGTAARVTDNRRLRRAIEASAEEVKRGTPLFEPLERSGEFAPSVVRIIEVGEKTGELDVLLQRLSEQYEQQIPYAVKRLTTFLEVAMITGMGALVALVAFAFLMPMAMVLDLV